MICKMCGNTIEDDSEFCYFCGWDLGREPVDELEAGPEDEPEKEPAAHFDFDLHGLNYKYDIRGNRGRRIVVYPNKAVIKTSLSLGSLATHNATDGEKTIFFKDVIGVQFKRPGLTIGFLQLETASALGNNIESNFFNENTFTFGELSFSRTYEAYGYILRQLEEIKSR